ncbi:hypothetical protein FRC18_003459 [Serendipita sp. 400]|nr:hypothetical protein FRC18_003459 [Serendipita sp. 400]
MQTVSASVGAVRLEEQKNLSVEPVQPVYMPFQCLHDRPVRLKDPKVCYAADWGIAPPNHLEILLDMSSHYTTERQQFGAIGHVLGPGPVSFSKRVMACRIASGSVLLFCPAHR